MTTCTPDRKIPYTEVAANLDKALDQADPQREAGLAQLARVRSAKQTLLQREQQRLSKKLGAAHPRVRAMERKREANTAMLREVNLDLARAATPPIELDDEAWVLHGRVMDRDRQGLPGLTLTLVDAKGNWVRELGYACSDKRGYFRFPDVELKAAPKPESGRSAQLFLRVSDRNDSVLHTDKPPLTPRPGRVDYREITLGEPPAQCRAPGNTGNTPPKPGSDTPGRPSADTRPNAPTNVVVKSEGKSGPGATEAAREEAPPQRATVAPRQSADKPTDKAFGKPSDKPSGGTKKK